MKDSSIFSLNLRIILFLNAFLNTVIYESFEILNISDNSAKQAKKEHTKTEQTKLHISISFHYNFTNLHDKIYINKEKTNPLYYIITLSY